mmetsp:Transcript_23264/g.51187  ORF Transcript_23264/g.51187 Transcript_23264/m.51187 type:complete len:171 (-) Transcript_23264:61-573(-)
MGDDIETFETTDAGASLTKPISCGDLKKGYHVVIKGHPCKISDISFSKTGKHGSAKGHMFGIDIFTGRKYEDVQPGHAAMEEPFVTREIYQLINVEEDAGTVSLLLPDGNTKDDLNLPDVPIPGQAEPSDDDRERTEKIKTMFNDGKSILVVVIGALGMEKIMDVQEGRD